MTYTQPELPGMPQPAEPTLVELDAVGRDLVRELNVCNDAIDKWNERRTAAYEQLKKLIVDDPEKEQNYVALHNGAVVAHASVYVERRFNGKAFQSDHPSLHDAYRQPAFRVRVTPDRTVL